MMMDRKGEEREKAVLLDLLEKKDTFNKEMMYYVSVPEGPFLSNAELIFIIEKFLEPNKKKAWDMLLARDPHNLCFADIIAKAEAPYTDIAMDILEKRGLCAMDFCYIVKCAKNEERREKAWNLVVELPHEDSYCFLYIMEYAEQPYKDRALEEFLKRKFPIKDLKTLLDVRDEKETVFGKEKVIPLLARIKK